MNKYASKDKPSNEGAPFPQTSAAPLHNFTLATAPQIAKACNVSRRTVDNWIKTRRVPYVKIGASVRFNPAEVMASLAKFTVHPVTTR